jgi:ERCC4-type nuclease
MKAVAEPVVFPVSVVIDTREGLPYTFAGLYADARQGRAPLTVLTVRCALPSGDYSLDGHERSLAVERKSLADLFNTLGQGRGRFQRELERLAAMPAAHVVIESSWTGILKDPPERSRLLPKTVHRSVISWVQRYPTIHWWPMCCRRLAEITTFRILERWLKARPVAKPGGTT